MSGGARALALGAAAGLAGTAAMTATQAIEMRLTRREPSLVPGQALAGLLRRDAQGEELERLSTTMHWGHGIAMGALRGLMGHPGGRLVGLGHFAALWGGDDALYVALGLAPPPWRWERSALLTDLGHKGVYAAVTSAAYGRLARR